MDIRETVIGSIKSALERLSIEVPEVEPEHPTELSHGDFATNVAMALAPQTGRNPKELAESIVQEMEKDLPDEIESAEVAGPGFINIRLSRTFFLNSLAQITEAGDSFGTSTALAGQRIIVEHSQPNPFKEFHIGHLVNNIIGESVSRVVRAHGADLRVVSYHGDVGLHVAKAIWAVLENDLPVESVSDLGRAYALGDEAYKESEEKKQRIIEINKAVYEGSDEQVNEIYKKGRELSLEHFDEIYSRLGSTFDNHFYESQSAPVGLELVRDHIGDIFEESEGAVIFPEERSGLHTRVFITSEGIAPYEAKDLGLIKLKHAYFPFDLSLNVVDVEQSQYFQVVNRAGGMVFPELDGRLEHIPHGRLRLATGRMSSRTGNIISGEEILDRVKGLALEKMQERDIENKEEVADKVAVAAVKYSVLRQTAGKNIVFDEEQSLSFEGDSGPYLQYSLVRARSILEKAEKEGVEPLSKDHQGEIGELERTLYRFPEVVERSWKERSPHHIATYLTALASAFNAFYAAERVVDPNDEHSPYKVALTVSFETVMQNGLELLGIPQLSEM